MKTVLFINHRVEACGVYQYGKRLGDILIKSEDIKFIYLEISSLEEYNVACQFYTYDAIIYNFHTLTLPWVHRNTLQKIKPNICINHESYHDCFDFCINIGPIDENGIPRPLLARPLLPTLSIQNVTVENPIPIIGSFGFGFNNKGFDRIIKYVNEQYDEAIIRLNITNPFFSDGNNRTVEMCNNVPRKPGIQVIITHDFMTNDQLLNWLSQHTINLFLYDPMHGRGPASVIDYALAVDVPIGISDSYMFRHLYHDDICVYKTPIKDIIKNGLSVVNQYKEAWSNDNLRNKMVEYLNKMVYSDIKKCNTIKMNNTVLTDTHRENLKPSIDELFQLLPEMMSRKIARANVQQAFAFNYIKENFDTSVKMLCAGSHEDTCCHGLLKLGYNIVTIDPVHNYDLHTYCRLNNYQQFDVVFSVSVIEHVPNDDEFIDDICKSLKPGGTCVLTCDFKNSYKPGDYIPHEDHRLYTEHDLLVRFKNILDNNNCTILGDCDYSALPDFEYANVYYSFATYVFTKNV